MVDQIKDATREVSSPLPPGSPGGPRIGEETAAEGVRGDAAGDPAAKSLAGGDIAGENLLSESLDGAHLEEDRAPREAAKPAPTKMVPAANSGHPEVDAWRELVTLLLQAITEHTIAFGDSDEGAFQQRISSAMETLNKSISTSQVLITAGSLSQAIAYHNNQTKSKLDKMAGDVGNIVDQLLGHVAKLQTDTSSKDLIAGLCRSSAELSANGELERLKQEFANSLPALWEHAEKARAEATQLTSKLQDRITVLEHSAKTSSASPAAVNNPQSGAAPVVDSCTGLLVRSEAEAAIQRAVEAEEPSYVGVFYLHRMQLTNARFGESIGDQLILFCSQHLATAILRSEDSLFRWSGPAFVAVFKRSDAHLTVNTEMQRMISAPMSRFFETASRSVYLPIKMTGEVYSTEDRTYAEMEDQIQSFLLKAFNGSAH